MLVGKWNFKGADGSLDDISDFWKTLELSKTGAKRTDRGLELTKDGWAKALPQEGKASEKIEDKTLISWLILNDIESDKKPSGSALTLDSIKGDTFDGIVFGEAADNTWSAGSNHLKRTVPADNKADLLESEAGKLIKMMLTYRTLEGGKGEIKLYKNDALLHSYTVDSQAAWDHSDMEVVFGARHMYEGGTTRGYMNATIVQAELRNHCVGMLQIDEMAQDSGGATAAGTSATAAEPSIALNKENKTYVELLVDSSGSMRDPINEDPSPTTKMEAAKAVLKKVVNDLPNIDIALRVFGADGCNTKLCVPLDELKNVKADLLKEIGDLQPRGSTPIASAISEVPEDLKTVEQGARLALLITDGDEQCGGNPLDAIKKLRELKGKDGTAYEVRTSIVGVAIKSDASRKTFQTWAEQGGGLYYDVANAEDFQSSVKQALSIEYTVMETQNGYTVSGPEHRYVGGPALPLAPGKYVVKLGESEQRQRVTIKAGQTTVVTVDRT